MRANATTKRARSALERPTRAISAGGHQPRFQKALPPIPRSHATDPQFWKTANVVLPTPKEIVTMRRHADLLRWFRRERGYQTRNNAILRAYMEAHESG